MFPFQMIKLDALIPHHQYESDFSLFSFLHFLHITLVSTVYQAAMFRFQMIVSMCQCVCLNVSVSIVSCALC